MYGNFNDIVDGKFLVLKKMSNQPQPGTMIHIMGVSQDQNNTYSVNYRVTETGQNSVNKFKNMKDFYSWARPDSFIAKNYEFLTLQEVQKYINVKKRNFLNFCLPLSIILLLIVWGLMLQLLSVPLSIIVGVVMSVVGCASILMFYRGQRKKIKSKMYKELLQKKFGVVFR